MRLRVFVASVAICALAALLPGLVSARDAPVAPAPAEPSFTCRSPSEIEAVICRDTALSDADRRLAALYQTARPGALNTGSNQLFAQRFWLADRNRRCAGAAWKVSGARSQRDCIASAYKERLEALAVASLMATPQAALAELRTVDPQAEPYYDALVAYATIDDPTERRRVVQAKITPLYAAMPANAREGLNDAGRPAWTVAGAAASDAAFARFLDVASVTGDSSLTWPCAALVRRPGLIAGLGAMYGGAIDGQLPNSDCEDALPYPGELTQLVKAANDAQSFCQGTIRFSTGKDYLMLEDAVRLHRPDVWRPELKDLSEASGFRREHAALVTRTTSALAAYFTREFKAAPPTAALEARDAVSALVAAAFNACS